VRCVVDDEIHPGQVLQRADVPALAADHAPLHVVARELHDGHGRLRRVGGGKPAHADGKDVAHAALGLELGLLVDLAQDLGRVVAGLVLDLLEEHLLGLRGAESGDALELAQVLALALLEQLALVVELAVAVVEPVVAATQLGQLDVDRLLLGDHALLDADDLAATLEQLRLHLVADQGRRWAAAAGPTRPAAGARL